MHTNLSKLPFGAHKNKRIRDCPASYLKWMAENLVDSDFHEWAMLAKDELSQRTNESTASLEEQADQFLRAHGYNPKKI